MLFGKHMFVAFCLSLYIYIYIMLVFSHLFVWPFVVARFLFGNVLGETWWYKGHIIQRWKNDVVKFAVSSGGYRTAVCVIWFMVS